MEYGHKLQQELTFATVSAHHANGKAVAELVSCRTWPIHNFFMPIDDGHRQQAIIANLWPYALHHTNDCHNNVPNMQDGHNKTLLQLFTGTHVTMNHKQWKPFGCLTFVLDEALQTG